MFVCVDDVVLCFCFYFVSTNVCSFFLFLFCFHEYTIPRILVEYNLEKFVSVEERYVAGESPPVE